MSRICFEVSTRVSHLSKSSQKDVDLPCQLGPIIRAVGAGTPSSDAGPGTMAFVTGVTLDCLQGFHIATCLLGMFPRAVLARGRTSHLLCSNSRGSGLIDDRLLNKC
jgi:hypothetical protein